MPQITHSGGETPVYPLAVLFAHVDYQALNLEIEKIEDEIEANNRKNLAIMAKNRALTVKRDELQKKLYQEQREAAEAAEAHIKAAQRCQSAECRNYLRFADVGRACPASCADRDSSGIPEKETAA